MADTRDKEKVQTDVGVGGLVYGRLSYFLYLLEIRCISMIFFKNPSDRTSDKELTSKSPERLKR